MFSKLTTFTISKDDVEVLGGGLAKTASTLVLPDGHKFDPEFLYMSVRAVSAGEYWGPNKNADLFPEEELKLGYKTFLTAHAFKNHDNKDVANAIGDVVEATWDDKMKYVELLIRIDKRVAPTIVRGFEKGFMTDVSMGCKIKHSICSICGNVAKTKQEYCTHINNERHKIHEDGRRVYEINIGPQFHDISAVLSGADKTAKVTGLLIVGEKVAFCGYDNQRPLEKVASAMLKSMSSSLEAPFFKSAEYHARPAGVAGDVDLLLESTPIVRGVTAKEEKSLQVENIKKMLQGKIIALAGAQVSEELPGSKNIDEVVRLLKLFYTDYWDERKCGEIASGIKRIAASRKMPTEEALAHFCHAAELAGISLTPLEFQWILSRLTGTGHNAEEVATSLARNVNPALFAPMLARSEELVDQTGPKLSLAALLKDRLVAHGGPGSSRPTKVVVRVTSDSPLSGSALQEIRQQLIGLIQSDIPHRSAHRAHLVPRAARIVKLDRQPEYNNLAHFLLPLVLASRDRSLMPLISDMCCYAAYQDERVKFAASDDYANSMQKLAHVVAGGCAVSSAMWASDNLQKRATDRSEELLRSSVATHGYSTDQLRRLNTAMCAKTRQATTSQTEDIMRKAASGDYLGLLGKTEASSDTDYGLGNILDSQSVDRAMSEHYSHNKKVIVKYATLLYAMGREDASTHLLAEYNLSGDDINKYLKIATDSVKMEIEKKANFWGQVALDAARDAIIGNPLSSSLLAVGPGNIIDGIIFTKIFNKLERDAKKRAGETGAVSQPAAAPPVATPPITTPIAAPPKAAANPPVSTGVPKAGIPQVPRLK